MTNNKIPSFEEIRKQHGLSNNNNSNNMGQSNAVPSFEEIRKEHVLKKTQATPKPSTNPVIQEKTVQKVTDYAGAVKLLKSKGVSAASIMTKSEWQRRKGKSGGTYQDYIKSQVSKYEDGNKGNVNSYAPKFPTITDYKAQKVSPANNNNKTTSFATETNNAYTNAKNKATEKTIITSDLSDEGRKKRIEEINNELKELNITIEGAGRAKSYTPKSLQGNLQTQIDEAKAKKAKLSEELKSLEEENNKFKQEKDLGEAINLITQLEDKKSYLATKQNKYSDEYWQNVHDEAVERFKAEGQWDSVKIENRAWAVVDEQRRIWKKEKKTAEKEIEELTEQLERLKSGAREANFYDVTIGAVKSGYYNMKSGIESFNKMNGLENEADYYNDLLASDEYNTYTDNKAYKVLQFVGELLGQQAYNILDPKVSSGVLTAGGIAALAGQAVPFPEEVITVPAAASAAYTAGAAMNTYKTTAGHTYEVLKQLGISDDVAKIVSPTVGFGVGVLETLQLDELMDAYVLGVTKGANDDILKVIANEILKRTKNTVAETVEEVAQEGVQIAGEAAAYKIDKGEGLYSWGDVGTRLGETATTSLIGFGAMNVPAVTINTTRSAINNKKIKNVGKDYADVQDEVIQSGLESDPESEAYKIAEQLKAKRDNGEVITNAELGRSVIATEREIQAENKAMAFESRDETLDAVDKLGYGEYGKKEFIDILENSNEDFDMVRKEFQYAYEFGRTNPEIVPDGVLKGTTQRIAFNAGKIYAMNELKDRVKLSKGVIIQGEGAGFKSDNKPSDVSDFTIKLIDMMAKFEGVKVYWRDDIKGNAEIVNGKGIVLLNRDFERYVDVGGKMKRVSAVYHAFHEILGHRAMELAPVETTAFMNELYRYMTEGVPNTAVTPVMKKQTDYANERVNLSVGGAMEEIMSSTTYNLLYGNDESLYRALDRIANGNNQEAISGMQKYMQMLNELWEKVKKWWDSLTGKEKADAKPVVDEVEHLRGLFEKAIIASNKRVQDAQNSTKITKGIENNAEIEYNEVVSHSLKQWHTDLNKEQFKDVMDRLRRAGSPETTKITDTANWYKGRLEGDDLFVIYSSVYTNDPTILYERRGKEARAELDILLKQLEEIENGGSIVEVSKDINTLLSGDWLQEKHNLANNNVGLGGRGSNTGYASVLQGKSSKFIGSQAFRKVIRNIFEIQEEIDLQKFEEKNSEYLELAKEPEKNETRLREILDEVAKEKGTILDNDGNPLKLYRGTKGGQTTFAKTNIHKGIVFTADNINIATRYGDGSVKTTNIANQKKDAPAIYALYGFPDKMITIDAQYMPFSDLVVPDELLKYSEGKYKATNTEIAEWAKLEGYDTVRIKNVRDGGGFIFGEQVLFLDSYKVKSADLVTYDDDGNIIPLSERFNKKNDNIRYSLKGNSKIKGEQYGVMWTLEKGVLDDGEVSAFYDKISETKNNNYKNYHKASDGQLIYEIGNKLIYTDEDFDYPQISKVIAFDTNDSYLLEYGKESFYDGEKYGDKTETIIEIVEAVLGEGTVETTTYSSYEADKRSGKSNNKGTNSTEANRRSQKDVRDNNSKNETEEDYNKNKSYSLKQWHTGLTKSQIEDVEKWVRRAGSPKSKMITNKTYWYKGRLNGRDLFVIYSTENVDDPTVLYLERGEKAKEELEILMDLLEDEEYGKSINGKPSFTQRVSKRDWVQNVNSSQDNLRHMGSGQNNQNAGVLSQQSKRNGSPAFRNVIEYCFRRQEEINSQKVEKKNSSLKGGTDLMSEYKEFRNTIEDVRDGKKNAESRLYKYVEDGTLSTKDYDELIEKYGAIPSGENPHREVQVPRKTADGKKVSQTVRTILEAKATPDEAVPTIEKMVEDGIFSYDAYTDKQAIKDAEDYLKEYGWNESLRDWLNDVEKGIVSKQHTAMGWALYNNAANTAMTSTSERERREAINDSLNILNAMVKHQRSAAQALQATRILKKLSPETQLYGVQKSVQALQNELINKYGNRAPDLKIDEVLAAEFLNAGTEDERLAAEIEIYKDIGRQVPSDWLDKWNAVRYIAMLANLRTHGRNILGNAFFAPVVIAKNLTATAIEAAVYRISGKKTVRGKALIVGNKADRELLKAAWNDYANVADLISNGGKYNDFAMQNKYIEEGRKIFDFKFVEWIRKTNSELLEKEDVWFSKPHYAYALAQYCKANNITAEQIERGKAIAPAREYAIKEAQKATYKDTNAFSQWVSELGRNGKNKKMFGKAVEPVVEGVLPFRKTPANILVRGVEYSPIGLIKGISYDLVQVSKGKMSATEAIDNISAGLTGTALLALGILLAAQGLIRGHGEDDKKEKEFKELMGHQAYALELPNGDSVTLDWLAPEALPFFVGVNIWEATKGSVEELNLSNILNVVSGISEPMLEMSCLQGVNDLIESVGYASSNDTSGLMSILTSATTSYLTQSVPSLLGQVERTGEENRMTTYTEKNDFLTKDMQYTLGKISSKIPFWDYNQIPYIDAWGRKEASGTALKRGFNNFLNPAYTSTIETSKMEKELLRLYEKTGEDAVFPSRANKYFTVDGVRKDLTADEYVRYATLKGEKSYKAVADLVKSKAYKSLDDNEKVKAIDEAYAYADQKAKQAISNYKPESWVKNADKFGSNVGNYLSFRANISDTKEDNGGEISKSEVVDIIMDMAQNDSETWFMYLSMYDNDNANYARDKGVRGETYMRFLDSLDEADQPTKSGKYGTYTQDEAYKAIKNLKGLSRQDKAILWQSVNTRWKANNNPFR